MLTINFVNEPNFDEIAKAGITMICDAEMNIKISKEDYKRLEDEFPAAYMDSIVIGNEDRYYHYKVQDREAGNVIGYFNTKDEANAAVVLFEENDKEDGTYTPDFYEIKLLEVDEETRYRVGELIKHLRFLKDMSQTQLAEAAGTNQFHISKIEAGEISPTIDVLARIAAALGKRIDLVD